MAVGDAIGGFFFHFGEDVAYYFWGTVGGFGGSGDLFEVLAGLSKVERYFGCGFQRSGKVNVTWGFVVLWDVLGW